MIGPDGGPPACAAHRALVDAALTADPTDEALEAYADAVPGCPACQRALAVWLAERDDTGVVRLRRPSRAPLDAPRARRPSTRVLVWAAAAAALAGVTAIAWWTPDAPEPGPLPIAANPPVPVGPPAPMPARPVGLIAPAPRVVVATPAPPRPAPTAPNWPPPPHVDLRLALAKGADPGVQAVQLVVSPPGGPRVPGDRVSLEVVATRETGLAVCVDGPERGVVWRGAVSAGRTALSRDGRRQSFAFAEPGTYRFRVGLDPDAPDCEPAVHRVDVDVGAAP
jgi:hypothetical protein